MRFTAAKYSALNWSFCFTNGRQMDPLQVVLQFLKEEGYHETFEVLLKEAETTYKPENLRRHILRQSLGEIALTEQTHLLRSMTTGHRFELGNELTRKPYDVAPISMISVDQELIVGFTDQSIRKLSASNEIIQTVNPKLATVLCFRRFQNVLIFGTMGGNVGVLDPSDLSIRGSVQIDNGAVMGIAISGNLAFAVTRAGNLGVIDIDSVSLRAKYPQGNPVKAICAVGNGVIYSVQSDSAFHFRSADDPEHEIFFSMNPTELDVGCIDIRDMVQSPADKDVFVALTDQGRANIYRYTPGKPQLDVMKVLTHFLSDGLSQPQMLWEHGPVLFSTSDDFKVIAIDVEKDELLFSIDGWKKATRCLTMMGDVLYVGALDKTVSSFELHKK